MSDKRIAFFEYLSRHISGRTQPADQRRSSSTAGSGRPVSATNEECVADVIHQAAGGEVATRDVDGESERLIPARLPAKSTIGW